MLPVMFPPKHNIMGHKNKIMKFIEKVEAMEEKLADYEVELYYHTNHIEF